MPRLCSSLLLLSLLIVSACSNRDPNAIYAYCRRWSDKYVRTGNHANHEAYREDLMVTCMALKNTSYVSQIPSKSPISDDDAWLNPSIPKDQFTRTLGRDKARCIERAYVGQSRSRGSSQAQVNGSAMAYGGVYGSGVSGSQSGSFSSTPVFDNDLFVACMNEEGWELAPTAVKPQRD
jgi:hypothetical protein